MFLLDFIKSNPNWETLITEKPYCVAVKHDGPYVMLSYNQCESDFYNPVVRECRGIILTYPQCVPVCMPFYKFGNWGEGYADVLDWTSARTLEKIDGSLIKVWYHNGDWKVSTNGTIDARKAEIQNDVSPYKNFYELFMQATINCNLNFDDLDKDYTYMFELVSPYNRVVIPYAEVSIYHIGTRSNSTFEEVDVDIGVKKPKQYNLTTLEECVNSAKALPYNDEGYVVVDKHWHRNKIKSPAWVAVHHLNNNGAVTKSRIVELIRLNEDQEFLSYYSEYSKHFEEARDKINAYITQAQDTLDYFNHQNFPDRKSFALEAQKTKHSAMLFCIIDSKFATVEDWFWNNNNDKIVRMIYV